MRFGFVFSKRFYDQNPKVNHPINVDVRFKKENIDGVATTLVNVVARKPFNVRTEVNGTITIHDHHPSRGHNANGFLAEEACVSEKFGSPLLVRTINSTHHQANVMCRVCEQQYGRIVQIKKLCLCRNCENATAYAIKRDDWDGENMNQSHAVRSKNYLEYLREYAGVMI